MSNKALSVGIVGLKPNESWAGVAHVPALQSLTEATNRPLPIA